MTAPIRIDVRDGRAYTLRVDDATMFAWDGEYVDAPSFDAVVAALQAAQQGLTSAANQFASIRESQAAGHTPEIRSNPELFADKADAATKALADLGLPTSPAPSIVAGRPSGTGGDLPCPRCGCERRDDCPGCSGGRSLSPAGRAGSDPVVPAGEGRVPTYRHRGCGGAIILKIGKEAEGQWDVVCRRCDDVPGPYDVIDSELYARSL